MKFWTGTGLCQVLLEVDFQKIKGTITSGAICQIFEKGFTLIQFKDFWIKAFEATFWGKATSVFSLPKKVSVLPVKVAQHPITQKKQPCIRLLGVHTSWRSVQFVMKSLEPENEILSWYRAVSSFAGSWFPKNERNDHQWSNMPNFWKGMDSDTIQAFLI